MVKRSLLNIHLIPKAMPSDEDKGLSKVRVTVFESNYEMFKDGYFNYYSPYDYNFLLGKSDGTVPTQDNIEAQHIDNNIVKYKPLSF